MWNPSSRTRYDCEGCYWDIMKKANPIWVPDACLHCCRATFEDTDKDNYVTVRELLEAFDVSNRMRSYGRKMSEWEDKSVLIALKE